jgi:ATP-dependent RNA helicase DOB1
MDDDMFSMLNKTKKVKKSKTVTPQGTSSSKAAGKRRARSDSQEAASQASVTEDGPSERKKAKVQTTDVDPMEALERGTGGSNAGDQTMEDVEQSNGNVGDASIDVELPSESSKPMPVVTDDFEQEAEREVAATSGFAKVEEGEKMRLVHQVRHQVSLLSD